ncbi:MAG: ISKra4 family transposase [Gammaproteobacteria bacterium]|nr:ISKra4 family transposase [Gammaproteobacteria bacterium]
MEKNEQAIKKSGFFAAAEQKFYALTDALQARHTSAMKFSDVEKLIENDGRELLRLLLQAHIDSRGDCDIGAFIDGMDGIRRTHKRIGERQIKSIFGAVQCERMGYGNRNAESLFPKDSHLNLPENLHSYELQRRVAREVMSGSFDDAVESITENTGQLIHKQQIEHITVSVTNDFDAFYQANLSQKNMIDAKKASLLILTTDGKGIVMHKDDLRKTTRKKADANNHKLEKRLSSGEKRNSKRMATVASVYNIDPFIRTAKDFKNELASVKAVKKEIERPKPIAKRVWASVEKSPEEVVREMFDEASHRDLEKNKKWVALVDGAPTQIKNIEREAKSRGIKITIVCDIIHVIEYLWRAAWGFFNKGDIKAESWVNERFIAILEGKSSSVAAGIRRTATNRKLKKAQREAIDTCCDYLLNKSPYLKYHQYLAKGFPIATGIIEGACRYLIKDRMDITGARWRIAGAEAVLKLRSLKASGDFTAYWKFHEEQEFNRIHKSKYKNPSVLNKLHIKVLTQNPKAN